MLTRRKLDEAALADLEDALVAADLGTDVAARVIAAFRRTRFGADVTDERGARRPGRAKSPPSSPRWRVPLVIDRSLKPHVVLMVGVNGTGKTTTIGKLAQSYAEQGMRTMMVAGDTFRAAAVEQLQVWGERTGAAVVAGGPGADAAGLAFDALDPRPRRGRRRAADRYRRAGCTTSPC